MIKLAASLATGTDSGTFDVLAYSGGLLRVGGWPQPVLIDLQSLEIPKSIPILDGHSNTVASMLGIGQARSDGRTLNVSGTWADTPNAQEARKVAKSMPLQASVGVEAIRWTLLEPGPFSANGQSFQLSEPVAFITGKLIEVSILPIGADSQSAVVSASGVSTMPTFEEWVKSLGFDLNTITDSQRASLDAIHKEMFSPTADSKAKNVSASGDVFSQARALEAVRASRGGPSFYIGRDGGQFTASNPVMNAIMVAGGRADLVAKRHGEQAAEMVRAAASDGWSGICRMAIEQAGESTRGLSRQALIQAAWSTTNLPVTLREGVQKLALEAFRELSDNWRAVTRKVEAADFKDGKAVRLTPALKFNIVAPGGMLTHGVLTEDAFTFKVATYGRIITLAREDIVNDDLGLLQDLPSLMASESDRLISDLVFGVLSGALAAGHFDDTTKKNLLTGAGSALSVTSLGNAIKLLRTQADKDGRVLNLAPATLIVPASLEGTARQVLSSMEVNRTNDNMPTGNPWQNAGIVPVVEPRLDASSATAWYLGARPADGALLAAFLRGVEGPTVEPVELSGSFLGTGWRAYLDVGAALGEHRAMVRANGA